MEQQGRRLRRYRERNRSSSVPREYHYRSRTYRQTCAPVLALVDDSNVNGIALPSDWRIVLPPPRMIGSIVYLN